MGLVNGVIAEHQMQTRRAAVGSAQIFQELDRHRGALVPDDARNNTPSARVERAEGEVP